MDKTGLKILLALLLLFSLLLSACKADATLAPTSAPPSPTTTPVPTGVPVPSSTPPPAPTTGPTAAPAWVEPVPPYAGVEIHRLADIDLVQGLGAAWVRRNALQWARVEPVEGERNWEAVAGLEAELQEMASRGIQVILVVRDTPAWAQQVPGSACGPASPESLDAFAAFLHDAVLRYSAPPFSVRYWELGNEPDVDVALVAPTSQFGCWGDAGDLEYYGGAYYGEMLKVVYPQIKLADPAAQVVVGGLLMNCNPVQPPENPPGSGQFMDCTPSRFLEGILESGAGNFFDGVAFHAYDYYYDTLGKYGNTNWRSGWSSTGPVVEAKVGYVRSLLASYGVMDKFLMNTETALLCGRDGTEPQCQTEEFALTKAYYVVEAFTIGRSLDLEANIWYSVSGWRGSGLVDASAGGDAARLPAYNALQVYLSLLDEAAFWREITDTPGVRIYEFRQGTQVIWVAWSQDGGEHLLPLPSVPQSVLDVMGQSLEATSEVAVTIAPIYLIWGTP